MTETSVEFVGPFERRAVVVNGWAVPLLEGIIDLAEERVWLSLDYRFAIDLPYAGHERVIEFIAQCIAVAQGFSCHPANPEAELNRGYSPSHPHRMHALGDVPPHTHSWEPQP